MTDGRRKPFVGWMPQGSVVQQYGFVYSHCGRSRFVPVIVTPLLPGDPKVGERWIGAKYTYTIASPPFEARVDRCVAALRDDGKFVYDLLVSALRPLPTMKTFRLDVGDQTYAGAGLTIEAESREAALAKLADALEEVADDG